MRRRKQKWKLGFERLARIHIGKKNFRIRNLRNFSYPDKVEEKPSAAWTTMTFNEDSITDAFIYRVPFLTVGVAHMMFGFRVGGRNIVMSPELRCRIGEKFSLTKAFFKDNNLCYIWGTAKDLVYVRNHVREGEPVYEHRLDIPKEKVVQLFRDVAKRTNRVNHQVVEKYHLLKNSCSYNVLIHLKAIGFSVSTYKQLFYSIFPSGITDEIERLTRVAKVQS